MKAIYLRHRGRGGNYVSVLRVAQGRLETPVKPSRLLVCSGLPLQISDHVFDGVHRLERGVVDLPGATLWRGRCNCRDGDVVYRLRLCTDLHRRKVFARETPDRLLSIRVGSPLIERDYQ